MTFKPVTVNEYPRRLWSLAGYPGSGKSTFAMTLRGPLLAVDADHRIDEVASLAAAGVFQLSDEPADNSVAERIAACLRANMIGSGVRTIVVDSLTAILSPLIAEAIIDNDAGRNRNRVAAFKAKAMAVRLLQDVVTGYGTDVLWIYHLVDARDGDAKAITRASISVTEQARLLRSLNLALRVIQEGAKRGIHVDWARRGRNGMTLWDDTGCWRGMPERIEQAVYAGLSKTDQDRIESITPATFTGPAQALAWAVEIGAFTELAHARNAYDKIKREEQPQTADAMWRLWTADAQARAAARSTATA